VDAVFTRLPVIVGGNVRLIAGKQIIKDELKRKLSESITAILLDLAVTMY
jgi:hypothetical protein